MEKLVKKWKVLLPCSWLHALLAAAFVLALELVCSCNELLCWPDADSTEISSLMAQWVELVDK